MGTKKKGQRGKGATEPLLIDHAQLAHHLRTAATRYRNVNSFLRHQGRDYDNKEKRIRENDKFREEAIKWAMALDPENTKSFIEKEDRYSTISNRWPYPS